VNRVRNLLCSSGWWARRAEHELVPFGLGGVELGDNVLETGPGFGATTRVLAGRVDRLSVVELDPGYCERLRAELGNGSGGVSVVQGDATALPDARFSAVVCFRMLHHIPTAAQQDQAFAEVARVLRPGGTCARTDSIGSREEVMPGRALVPVARNQPLADGAEATYLVVRSPSAGQRAVARRAAARARCCSCSTRRSSCSSVRRTCPEIVGAATRSAAQPLRPAPSTT
jgi:SAM-dependent methyltransferase